MPDSTKGDDMNDASGKPVKRLGILSRVRAYFIAGVLVLAPIAITLALAFWLVDFVDSRVVPLIPAQWNPDTYLKERFGVEFGLPGLGVLVLMIVITLIGWLTAGYVGRVTVRIGENMVARMPVVRSIYGAIKQIFVTVLHNQSDSFRQAVLVEYPRRGTWTIAFVTGETEGEVQNLTKEEVVNIYVPTTPNPTSGFLLFVPREDVVFLDMPVEDAFKMIVSIGIVTPTDTRPDSVRNTPLVSARTYDYPQRPETPPRPARVANLIED